ncbi:MULTISPECIES: pilin major subunit VirB2 [Rhizobium/Agrobacterium group]|uniref:Pilin major subunit VirB2 n=5 Tax=Rhizobium/Agrobacterium group TaxID=227290 RepID=Q9F5A1_RHIRH|nr:MULTISPECIES: pilin major subunit VirB2 [Rhizobium/Agrobacterium group]ABW33679.1 rcorf122 [Rhizobium rhizogenes]AQS65414.1 pilin major subunit VirB2 [Rhizobium rhizogenes]ASK42180.1 type IV secretion system protein VirB2 [Rhizobium rhizogenes]ASK42871.1 type IV secretion system protein VirB2 [Rhizobium rhizogenes]MCZ7445576.1 pilin major subunit VirB2 [Rhizobium rhizogenes]
MAWLEGYRAPSKFRGLWHRAVRLLAPHVPSVTGAIGWSLFFCEPAAAQAAGGTDPATMVNNICTFILGPFGQSLAVLGIVAIGVSWMFGRASLGLVAGVVGGIVIMFGASFLGQTLTGGGG